MNIIQRKQEFESSLRLLGLQYRDNYTFSDIVNPYLDRPYHNLEHIERCLKELDTCGLSKVEKSTLTVAIWFHDLVYDTNSCSNEFYSASKLYSMLTYTQDCSIFNELVDIILATRYRTTDNNLRFTVNQLIMRECDLVSLIDDIDNVLKNDKLIRQEFIHVSETDWKDNRVVFLRQLVDINPFTLDEENKILKDNVEKLIQLRYT